ncbi:trypsin-like peptidase domain-containing protein [Streptomyces sp. NPDC058457]|uniref:trypsin-like peptidase domain-containing protein n=1 Tax=Streptomyces sp. NPDC058457 TaxID=3346507 RepID=UPI003649C7EB
METERIACIRFTLDAEVRYGSGLFISANTVLTADHVAEGRDHVLLRIVGDEPLAEHRVTHVIRSGHSDVDLALLIVADPVPGLEPIRFARVDRSRLGRIEGCVAVGFPWWRMGGTDGGLRRSAHVEGHVPLAEGFVIPTAGRPTGPALLTLVGDRTPADRPPVSEGYGPSPWGGMSGAVVLAGPVGEQRVLGVVTMVNMAAGPQSLTVTPVTALEALQPLDYAPFARALGWGDRPEFDQLAPQLGVETRWVGDLVTDCHPVRHLHVHPSIVGYGPPTARYDPLPFYIERAHDRELRARLAAASSGAADVVVLVGMSSTGKSRAAYEAVRAIVPDWRVFFPSDAQELLAAVEDDRVADSTVVWLDDAWQLIGDDPAQQAGIALERLLRPGRGPLLVIATMWPEHWDKINSPDARKASRLLRMYECIRVPDDFTGVRDEDLQRAIDYDPAIAESVETVGRGGGVTQFLAGGPFLINHYETRGGLQRRLLEVALDAARIGLRSVTTAFLETALAPSEEGGHSAHGPAFEEAVHALTRVEPVAPVSVSRTAPHAYQLADFLAQHADALRRDPPLPEVWTAALSCPSQEERWNVAIKAYSCHYYRIATLLWADHGRIELDGYAREKINDIERLIPPPVEQLPNWNSMRPPEWPNLIFSMIFISGSFEIYQPRSVFGVGPILMALVLFFALAMTQIGWALLWTRNPRFDALFRKSPEAALELARRADGRAKLSAAVHWLQRVGPPRGEYPEDRLVALSFARFVVAAERIDVLLDMFPPDGEIDVLWKGRALTTTGCSLRESWEPESPPLVLLRAHRPAEAAEWLEGAVRAHGNGRDLTCGLVEILTELERFDEAVEWLATVQPGRGSVNRPLLEGLIRGGRLREAADFVRQEAPYTDDGYLIWASSPLAEALEAAGELQTAESFLRDLCPEDLVYYNRMRPDLNPHLRLALLLARHGAEEKADALYLDGMERAGGDEDWLNETRFQYGLFLAYRGRLRDLHLLQGLRYEELTMLTAFAGANGDQRLDGSVYLSDLVRFLELTGQVDEALEVLDLRVRARGLNGVKPDGHFYARTGILARARRSEECYLLWKYGMEPDGSPARPWHPKSRTSGLFTDDVLPSKEHLDTFAAHHTIY